MKKILAVTVLILMLLPFAAAGSGGDTGEWVIREMENGFVPAGEDGIASESAAGTSASGSSAIWSAPLEGKRFRISFDVVWGDDNKNEGESGYLSSFMQIFLTDSVSFPSGSQGYMPSPGFRVETGHIQAENTGSFVESRSAAIVDFGGKTLKTMGKTRFFLEAKNNSLSVWVADGGKKRGTVSYSLRDGYFTDESVFYFGVSNYGEIDCQVDNVVVYDISADPYEPETNSLGGLGFDFSGGNTYMVSGGEVADPVTVECWLKIPRNTANGTQVGCIFSNGSAVIEGSTNGTVRATFSGRAVAFDSVDVRTGNWIHMAVVRDDAGGRVILYLNGAPVQEAPFSPPAQRTGGLPAAYAGNNHRMTRSLHGEMSDLRLWNRARSADEIRENMERTVPPDAEGLILNLPLAGTENANGAKCASTDGKTVFTVKKRVIFVDRPAAEDYDYTIAVIPDTQVMTGGYTDFSAFTALTEYLKNSSEKEKIAFALHVGDVVNDPNDKQYSMAKQAMGILDGFLPYVVVPGNHDYDTKSETKRDTSMFNRYFPLSFYKNASGFGGAFEEGRTDNTFWLFDAGSEKFLVMALEFGPRDSVIEWANRITEQYVDRRVIVVTHTDVHYDGGMITVTSENAPTNYRNGGYLDVPGDPPNNGDDLWEKYLKLHENIFLVVSGHVLSDNIVTRTDTGANGNKVYRMLINAQGLDFNMWLDREKFGCDGLGMVCLLRFSENASKMQVEYYSPYLDKYLNSENQFTVDLSGEKGAEPLAPGDGTDMPDRENGENRLLPWLLIPALAVLSALGFFLVFRKKK